MQNARQQAGISTRQLAWGPVLAASVLLLLGACSEDDDQLAVNPAPTTTDAAPAPPPPTGSEPSAPAPHHDSAPKQAFTDPPLPPELEESASGLLPLPPRPSL